MATAKKSKAVELAEEVTEAPVALMDDFTVTIRGKELTLSAPASLDDAPFDVLSDFENERVTTAFLKIIDPQSRNLLARHNVTVNELLTIVLPKWSELQAGE